MNRIAFYLLPLLLLLAAVLPLGAMDAASRLLPPPQRLESTGPVFTPAATTAEQTVDQTIPPEGFRLTLKPERLEIAASTPVGARRGERALARLLRESGGTLPEAVIESAPELPWRGAFLSWRMIEATPEAMTRLKALFRAFSELGINRLVIEFADNIAYESQPFPARVGKAFTKEQIRELLAEAAACDIEIIPYFQALSHCVWILSNPENRQLLEDPGRLDWHTAWCPEKPETRRFFEDILRETVELFQPRYLHLAYDEISYGPYRVCDACRRKQPGELLFDSIMADYAFLRERGTGMILFHDQLIPPANGPEGSSTVEGWTILERLPRDIVISPWLYGHDSAEFRRVLDYFAQYQFPLLGAGFEDLDGLPLFARELTRTPGALGLIDTYWFRAGDWSQYQIAPIAAAATTVTAAVAWNPDFIWSDVPIDPVAALMSTWLEWEALAPQETLTRLLPPAGRSFGDAPTQWPGRRFGTLAPLRAEVAVAGLPETPEPGVALWAVSGREGDGFPAEAPELNANIRASELIFLHASGLPDNRFALSYLFGSLAKPELGRYRVVYADGSEEVLPLAYNDNISDWNSIWGPTRSALRYTTAGSGGERIGFSVWRWRNPAPEKVIAKLKLESAHYEHTALLVNAVYARSAEPAPLMIESFDPVPDAAPLAHWTVNAGNLNPGGLSLLPVPALTEGGGAVELRTPGSAGAGARITLDLPVDWSRTPEMKKRVFSLDLSVETQQAFTLGVYLGNADWSAYQVAYIGVENGFNRITFAPEGLTAEAGTLAFEQVRQLRLSFFLPGTAEPVRIVMDNLNCSLPGTEVNLNLK